MPTQAKKHSLAVSAKFQPLAAHYVTLRYIGSRLLKMPPFSCIASETWRVPHGPQLLNRGGESVPPRIQGVCVSLPIIYHRQIQTPTPPNSLDLPLWSIFSENIGKRAIPNPRMYPILSVLGRCRKEID